MTDPSGQRKTTWVRLPHPGITTWSERWSEIFSRQCSTAQSHPMRKMPSTASPQSPMNFLLVIIWLAVCSLFFFLFLSCLFFLCCFLRFYRKWLYMHCFLQVGKLLISFLSIRSVNLDIKSHIISCIFVSRCTWWQRF